MIGPRGLCRFKKRWLVSRENNYLTNLMLCNAMSRNNNAPELGPIRKGVITRRVWKSPSRRACLDVEASTTLWVERFFVKLCLRAVSASWIVAGLSHSSDQASVV